MYNRTESNHTGATVRASDGEMSQAADDGACHSRRRFLRVAGATSAAGAIVLGSAPAKPALAAGGRRRVNVDPFAIMLFREIQADEEAHVSILQGLLADDPGNPFLKDRVFPHGVRPMPALNLANLVQPNFGAFVAQAAAFENRGSGTYGGALFAIQQTPEYFQQAVGITTVEARHASWLNTLLGEMLVPAGGKFGDHDEAPITQDSTLAAIAPFISQLAGPTPSFSATLPDDPEAADENNFRVLDYLLVLEYIESTFYDLNVKKFFGNHGGR